jgi:hypothetical protein
MIATDGALNTLITKAMREVISTVPTSSESTAQSPKERVQNLAFRAKCLAATTSATLALPPGPLGLLTIVPDLIIIWKIQAQLAADIAAVYGVRSKFNESAMLFCLFRYGTAAFARDLLVRVGTKIVVRRASLKVVQDVLAKVGIKVTQRILGSTASRAIPLIGAGAIGAYAWYDTDQVAVTTERLCRKLVRRTTTKQKMSHTSLPSRKPTRPKTKHL